MKSSGHFRETRVKPMYERKRNEIDRKKDRGISFLFCYLQHPERERNVCLVLEVIPMLNSNACNP